MKVFAHRTDTVTLVNVHGDGLVLNVKFAQLNALQIHVQLTKNAKLNSVVVMNAFVQRTEPALIVKFKTIYVLHTHVKTVVFVILLKAVHTLVNANNHGQDHIVIKYGKILAQKKL